MPSTSELSVTASAEKRRAIKTFKPSPIPKEIFQKIIDTMRTAPSSFNLQQTRVVIVQSKEQKQALCEAAWKQPKVIEAPATFVFAVSIRSWEKNLEKIISIGAKSGAWPEKVGDFLRKNVAPFQNKLGAAKEREYAIKDAMIMATIACLTAESFGLSTCFMNGWDENTVKKVIGAENNPDIAIAVLLSVGYPAEIPKNPGRLPQNETVFWDRL